MNILFLLHPKESVAYLNCNHTIRQGLEKMRFHGYTAIPVIDDEGVYVGTCTEGDFLWHIVESKKCGLEAQEEFTISRILRRGWNPPAKISTTMDELLVQVADQNFVPVVDDRGCFVGIITRKDVINYISNKK